MLANYYTVNQTFSHDKFPRVISPPTEAAKIILTTVYLLIINNKLFDVDKVSRVKFSPPSRVAKNF